MPQLPAAISNSSQELNPSCYLTNYLTHQPTQSTVLNCTESESESYVTTDGQSPVCLGIEHPSGAYDQIFITVGQLCVYWRRALSLTRRQGLSFTIEADSRQRSLSWVRVPSDAWSYFSVSDSRLHFSSPPTTCKTTVEILDSAKVKVTLWLMVVSQSWCRAPSEAHGQIFITVWQLQSWFLWGALSEHNNSMATREYNNNGKRCFLFRPCRYISRTSWELRSISE
jgi:hypothetical protein